ncbi:MAG: hypothetical protein HKN77_04845, partial [Woeseiaceae bacterium]|nr:hypothetical protein [Woeseiaceae bacterium]
MASRKTVFLGAFSFMFLLVSCGSGDSDSAAVASRDVGVTAEYDWFLEGVTPAGRTKATRTGDGRISNSSFIHWNNREYTLESELQLDEDGMVVSQTLRGKSAFGATIDETFTYVDGIAEWRTPGEGGSARSGDKAYYLASETLDTESLGALVRAAARQLDSELSLYPSGSARVEKLTSATVTSPHGPATLSLYAVSGIGFTPTYAWFDSDMNIAVVDKSGWLSMVPKAWNPAVLKELSAAQSAAEAQFIAQISGNLANQINGPLVIENIHVVDVKNGRLKPNQNVMLEAGKISLIDSRPIERSDAVRIDGSGRYLVPGMWDMHGHFGLSDGVLNIAGGVTSVRDIGGNHEKVMELTSKYQSGEVIGPTTYRAGFMDRAGPFASGWAAESLQHALDRVDFFAEHGYKQIKLYSSIEPEWVKPIADRAHSHGMRLSGHIPAFMSAEQAVKAGYDEIQHINMVFLNFLAGDKEDTRKQLRFTLYG